MPDLIIRSALSRDRASIGNVLARSYGTLLAADYPEVLLQEVLPILTRVRPELLTQPGYLVAERAGRVAAVGGWTPAAPQGGSDGEDVGHVRHVACDPECLRQGVTRALMLAAIAQARAAGMRLLCCLSTRTAVPFYHALGFEGAAAIELRLRPGLFFPAAEMRRCL